MKNRLLLHPSVKFTLTDTITDCKELRHIILNWGDIHMKSEKSELSFNQREALLKTLRTALRKTGIGIRALNGIKYRKN